MTRRPLAGAIALVIALTACTSGGTDDPLDPQPASGGILRVHRTNPGGGMDAIVAGIVEVDIDAGCLWLSDDGGTRHPVVWPLGTAVTLDPFVIRLADGTTVRAGDLVEGGGGYVDVDAVANIGLTPFETRCVQVDEVAMFNARSEIAVTVGVGLDLPDTLASRFAPPDSIGLELIAVNPNARSVAVADFVTGTVHVFRPGDYNGPADSIDGASGGGGFIHLWSQGNVFSYPGSFDSEPLVYQPEPLREIDGLAAPLWVVPAPDGERTWVVQAAVDDEPTLIELINLVEVQVNRIMNTEVGGDWHPVGATTDGLVLIQDHPRLRTTIVGNDGAQRTVDGLALSVGWSGVAIVDSNGTLFVTDAALSGRTPVDKPPDGTWVGVGGPTIPATSPPLLTGAERFVVMLADDPDQGPVGSGRLVIVDGSGSAEPVFTLPGGPQAAGWSRGGDWVAVVHDQSSVTLVSADGRQPEAPLGDIIPADHWVLSAG